MKSSRTSLSLSLYIFHNTNTKIIIIIICSFDSFEVLRVIGEGNYGKIFLARKKDNKKVYAIKTVDKQRMMAEGELVNNN